MHHLLPWFLTGRLREEETAAFRAHLDACSTCREDRLWVEKMRAEIDTHGAAVLEDHPDPDALVGAVLGEVDGEEAARVRRHLALCPTCELEARWVAGDAVVGELSVRSPRFLTRHAGWGWMAAAAASVGIVALLAIPRRGPEGPAEMLKPAVLMPALRAPAEGNVFTLGAGEAGLELVLEADLPPADFPVEVEVVDQAGRTVYRRSGVGRDYLVEGTENGIHLLVPCPRERCSPGSYLARIRGKGGGEPLEFPFRIAAP